MPSLPPSDCATCVSSVTFFASETKQVNEKQQVTNHNKENQRLSNTTSYGLLSLSININKCQSKNRIEIDMKTIRKPGRLNVFLYVLQPFFQQ